MKNKYMALQSVNTSLIIVVSNNIMLTIEYLLAWNPYKKEYENENVGAFNTHL